MLKFCLHFLSSKDQLIRGERHSGFLFYLLKERLSTRTNSSMGLGVPDMITN